MIEGFSQPLNVLLTHNFTPKKQGSLTFFNDYKSPSKNSKRTLGLRRAYLRRRWHRIFF